MSSMEKKMGPLKFAVWLEIVVAAVIPPDRWFQWSGAEKCR